MRVRAGGWTAVFVLGAVVLFLLAAAIIAVKIIIWLLPLIIVAVAALALLYIFNRPPKKQGPIDVEYTVKN